MLHSICIHVLSLFLYSTFCELCGIFFAQAPAKTVPQTSCHLFFLVFLGWLLYFMVWYVLWYFFILAWMVFRQAEFKSALRPIEFSLWEKSFLWITNSKSFEDISPILMSSNFIDYNAQRLIIWSSVEIKVVDIMCPQANIPPKLNSALKNNNRTPHLALIIRAPWKLRW